MASHERTTRGVRALLRLAHGHLAHLAQRVVTVARIGPGEARAADDPQQHGMLRADADRDRTRAAVLPNHEKQLILVAGHGHGRVRDSEIVEWLHLEPFEWRLAGMGSAPDRASS